MHCSVLQRLSDSLFQFQNRLYTPVITITGDVSVPLSNEVSTNSLGAMITFKMLILCFLLSILTENQLTAMVFHDVEQELQKLSSNCGSNWVVDVLRNPKYLNTFREL